MAINGAQGSDGSNLLQYHHGHVLSRLDHRALLRPQSDLQGSEGQAERAEATLNHWHCDHIRDCYLDIYLQLRNVPIHDDQV